MNHYELTLHLANGELWQDYTYVEDRNSAIEAFLSALPEEMTWEIVRSHTKVFNMNYERNWKNRNNQ